MLLFEPQRHLFYPPPAPQVPAIVRMARAALASGKCAVIGLQSTGEARTADVVAEKGEQLDDFVSGANCNQLGWMTTCMGMVHVVFVW